MELQKQKNTDFSKSSLKKFKNILKCNEMIQVLEGKMKKIWKKVSNRGESEKS